MEIKGRNRNLVNIKSTPKINSKEDFNSKEDYIFTTNKGIIKNQAIVTELA